MSSKKSTYIVLIIFNIFHKNNLFESFTPELNKKKLILINLRKSLHNQL